MYKALSPGAISVHTRTLSEAIVAAQKGGFHGVEFSPNEVGNLITEHGAHYVTDLSQSHAE